MSIIIEKFKHFVVCLLHTEIWEMVYSKALIPLKRYMPIFGAPVSGRFNFGFENMIYQWYVVVSSKGLLRYADLHNSDDPFKHGKNPANSYFYLKSTIILCFLHSPAGVSMSFRSYTYKSIWSCLVTTFPTRFRLYWNIVTGPFMILIKKQYNSSVNF